VVDRAGGLMELCFAADLQSSIPYQSYQSLLSLYSTFTSEDEEMHCGGKNKNVQHKSDENIKE
jgi:hypothetical protein